MSFISRAMGLTLLIFTPIALLHPAWATTARVPVVPTWIKNDLEKKRATIVIAADWNTNNEWANLNGYYRGNATIFAPVDWTVTIQFTNNSDHYPHSLILTKQFAEGSLPIKLTAADAVDGVMTRDAFYGLQPAERDEIVFKATKGSYLLASGKGVDLFEGDYMKFEMRDDFAKAMYVADGEVNSGQQPGRQ